MAYKGSSTQRRRVEDSGQTKQAEAPRNTGGSDNSTYNVDYAPSLKEAEKAAANARTTASLRTIAAKRRYGLEARLQELENLRKSGQDDEAAAINRDENRFKSSEKSDTLSKNQQDNLDSREKNNVFLNTIMGGGVGGNPSADKKDFEVEGQNKLRSQFEYLKDKYGEKFADTSQGRMLQDYLSGVPTERGGGLGSFDPTFGGGIDLGDFSPDELKESEEYRQQQLGIMGLPEGVQTYGPRAGGPDQFNKDTFDADLARRGLSSDGYQNFIRQMIAADPRQGNTLGEESFGNPLSDVLEKLLPGNILAKGFLGNEPQTESEAYGSGNRIFYDTSVPREDNSVYNDDSGIMGTQPGYDMSIYGSRIGQEGPFTADFRDQDGDGVDDRHQSGPGQGSVPKGDKLNPPIADLTPRPGIGMPDTVTHGLLGGTSNVPSGLETLAGPSLPQQNFNYANMAPQYGNQGINDPRFAQYYKNLQMFPRRA